MSFLFGLMFGGLLVYSAFYDVVNRKIPNWISIALCVAFLPAALLAGMDLGQIGGHLLVGLIAFVAGAALFYMNIWGGGDAKLVAACALWIGGGTASGQYLYGIALAGGIVGAVLLVIRRAKISIQPDWLGRCLDPQRGVPYAVAIAVGGFVAAKSSPLLLPVFQTVSGN